MKKIIIAIVLFICRLSFGQVSGNIHVQGPVLFPDANIEINGPSSSDILISVKGLANVKPDLYVAIFSVSQTGKDAKEINELIDKRISQSLAAIRLMKGIETYVDMVSFIPVYDLEAEMKVFSKKTYNEIPAGFELKKNIHIKYADPNQLNDFISVLSDNEIYDLVRVDCFSNTLDLVRKDLHNKAKIIVQEKMKNYETLLGETFVSYEKWMADEYKVSLPAENYKSYVAYTNSSLISDKLGIKRAVKPLTLFYQPMLDKEFDFVINPVVLEPVIQVMYEMKVSIHREKKPTLKVEREYVWVTPNGELKPLTLK